MNFKEAVCSGEKVRSILWKDKSRMMDTTIFTDKMEPFILELLQKSSIPLTWKEILNEWELVK